MAVQLETKAYTAEEYLAFELNSDERHDYIDGEIVLMTGGTPEHNEIVSILNAALRIALKGKSYSIFVADQRLWIPARNLYTYPDVMVTCRPLQRHSKRQDTITNPLLIAEVLSQSTKRYDRDEQFSAYRTIDTFQEYLLIDQYAMHVEQYEKTAAGKWLFSEYDGADACIAFSSIPLEMTLADLYDDVLLNRPDT